MPEERIQERSRASEGFPGKFFPDTLLSEGLLHPGSGALRLPPEKEKTRPSGLSGTRSKNRLTSRGQSPIIARENAILAQWLEHVTCNLGVVSSNLTDGCVRNTGRFPSGQREQTVNLLLRLRRFESFSPQFFKR